MGKKLTLCMINYNGEHYLDESLTAVLAQKDRFGEILVIDNGSQDNSLGLIRERFADVKVIPLEQNFGPAKARNVGFQAAQGERVLFVDNDVILAAGCIDHLMAALDAFPQAAVAMPRVFFAHDKQRIQYDGADNHFLGLMILHHVNESLATTTEEIRRMGSVVTACFLIDRSRWRGVVPFDNSFFFNYEDHDFGLRTRLLGHEILAVPAARVYHREGTAGLSYRAGKNYAPRRVFYLIRNRWQIILKAYTSKTLLFLSPMLLIYEIFQLGGVIKKGWLAQWLKACLWMFFNMSVVWQKRQDIQRSRQTLDQAVLNNGPIPFTKDLTGGLLERQAKAVLDRITALYWNQIQRFI